MMAKDHDEQDSGRIASPPSVGENHRRSLNTALALLDEMLCQFERWADGAAARGVMFEERNGLGPVQREALRERILALRDLMAELRDDLDLEPTVQDVGAAVWSRSSAFWETLVELGPRYLRRYGEMSPELVAYLDPMVDKLVRGLDAVGASVRRVPPPDAKTEDGGGAAGPTSTPEA